MDLSVQEARALFTSEVVDVYRERNRPTPFLQSFFTSTTTGSLNVSIEVERGSERVAADVVRGTDGKRNTWTRTTQKLIQPPYYREFFDLTQLQMYDTLFVQNGAVTTKVLDAIIRDGAERLEEVTDKIVRAKEVQASNVFVDGIVKLKSMDNIDFKRKSASIVDKGAGQYWATNGVNPFKDFAAGCKFLRITGKAMGGTFNAILGEGVLGDLFTNDVFLKRQDLKNMALDSVAPPTRDAIGSAYHGTITCGAYRVHLWSYPQYYDVVSGETVTSAQYIPDELVVLIPVAPKFKMAHAAVPQLVEPGGAPEIGEYIFNQKRDTWDATHLMDVKSAPVAIPTAIDQIYTLQAKASA